MLLLAANGQHTIVADVDFDVLFRDARKLCGDVVVFLVFRDVHTRNERDGRIGVTACYHRAFQLTHPVVHPANQAIESFERIELNQ